MSRRGIFYQNILGEGTSSSVPVKKRKYNSTFIEDDDDDDAATIIMDDVKEEQSCNFIFEPNEDYEWKRQTVGKYIEVCLLQSGKDILIKKTLKGGEKKTLKLSLDEGSYLTKRKNKIVEVCETVESSQGNQNAKLEFGNDKLLQFKYFEGMLIVDIRHYYFDINGVKCPGKNGVTTTPDSLDQLLQAIEEMINYTRH